MPTSCTWSVPTDRPHPQPPLAAARPAARHTRRPTGLLAPGLFCLPPALQVNTLERLFGNPAVHFQWVWLIDFNGWGWSHAMQAKVGINTLSAFGSHMPERLGRIILLNPPRVLDMLMAVIKPFIDARTSGKIVALHLEPRAIAATLAKDHHFPADVAAWVQAAAGMEAVPGNLPPLPAGAEELQITHPVPTPPAPSTTTATPAAAPTASSGDADATATGGAAATVAAGDSNFTGGAGTGGGDAGPP